MPSRSTSIAAQLVAELQSDPAVREELMRTLGDGFATRQDLIEQGKILQRHTEVLEQLTDAVREQGKRIEEQGKRIEEQGKRIEEQGKRIEEQGKRIEIQGERVEEAFRRVEALGARWGLYSEESFREGMRSVLERRFNAKVRHWEGFDPEGVVFGHPASIELDLVISNGSSLVIEVKSHVSVGDLAAFERKAKLYELQTNSKVGRMIVSPAIDKRAAQMAEELGIEVSTHL